MRNRRLTAGSSSSASRSAWLRAIDALVRFRRGFFHRAVYFFPRPQATSFAGLELAAILGYSVLKSGREERLRERAVDRWFRTFFESSRDAFIVFDSAGSIIAANPAVAEQLGHAPQELRGRSIGDILPLLAGERSRHLSTSSEYEARHRDGAVVPLEVSLSPIQWGGQPAIMARLGRRALATKKAAASIGSAAIPAVFDAEFLSILMHELRTPLQAMLGWTQVLRSAPRDPQETDQVLAAIERNIYWQAQVIDDLLVLARILSGELRLEIRRTSATAVIESAVARIARAAQSKRIRFVQRFEGERDEILADPDCLTPAIWRLLFDAVRFTAEGGEVEIRLERVGSSLRISITDDGGANDPAASHASGWFRHSASSTTDFGRFGVGLSVVQRLVEMHGGRVGAENAGPGRGASFFVMLPLVAERDGT